MTSSELNKPYWILRIVFGAVPIVAGLDKFTNLLTNWQQYLSPLVSRTFPPATFMHFVGIVEIIAGVVVLSRFARLGAYLLALWLIAIAMNLVTTGQYLDVAVRDLVMAAGAFTLAKLEESREHQATREVPASATPAHA